MESRVLISMVDYVLELCRDRSFETRDSAFGTLVENYAIFLSMPLTEKIINECFENISLMQKSYYLSAYSKVEDLTKVTNTLSFILIKESAITKYQI